MSYTLATLKEASDLVDNDVVQRTISWGKDNNLKYEQNQECDPEGLSAKLLHLTECRLCKIENEQINTLVLKHLHKLSEQCTYWANSMYGITMGNNKKNGTILSCFLEVLPEPPWIHK
jgi:hypothetical protein